MIEQEGRIRIIKRGMVLTEPFLDLTHKVVNGTELGMLGLAFHPEYAANGTFFVYYIDSGSPSGWRSVVARFRVSSDLDRADPASETLILAQPQPWNVHKGGQIFFGPDGYLYIPFGDGGLSTSLQDNGQRLDTWLAKILRIDVDGGVPYSIPPNNPFVGKDGLDEIWALGLRNPWRVSIDPVTGHTYIGDVGEQRYEEIDVVPAGSSGLNFGWWRMEGMHCYRSGCDFDDFTLPVVEYLHSAGACSIIGGFVYRGCALPALHGSYFHGDYCAGFVRSLVYSAGSATERRDWTDDLQPAGRVLNQITSFGLDARGELYVCDLDGEIFKIVPDPEP